MQIFLSIVYVLVCLFLILVVLLQSGRGGGMGAAFGGASQQVFGGAGAGNILTRLTAIGAALFMVLSATLAYMSSTSDTALERAKRDLEAREAARSGAPVGGEEKAPETPKPAGMSVPDKPEPGQAEEQPAPDEAQEPSGAIEGAADQPAAAEKPDTKPAPGGQAPAPATP